MKFANEHATMIATDDGRCIPADPANADYAALVAAGAAVEPYVAPLPPPPTVEDVRAEASRRMQHVVGARDAAHLQIVIANASREAIRLLRVTADRPWTEGEVARAAALEAADAAIEAIRAASNVLEAMDPVPADFATSAIWPPLPGYGAATFPGQFLP